MKLTHLGDRIMAVVVMAAVVLIFLLLGFVGVVCWLGDLALAKFVILIKRMKGKMK